MNRNLEAEPLSFLFEEPKGRVGRPESSVIIDDWTTFEETLLVGCKVILIVAGLSLRRLMKFHTCT